MGGILGASPSSGGILGSLMGAPAGQAAAGLLSGVGNSTPVKTDPRDMSAQYNTQLSDDDEKEFQEWVHESGRQRDLYDYDLRGAWKADSKAAANGHLPDTWKKPNHPTFSEESQYSSPQLPGGKWAQEPDGRWSFVPSELNIKNLGVNGLRDYFKRVEPDADLILPQGEAE